MQAVHSLRNAQPEDAHTLLREALRADDEYAPAWQWVAALCTDPAEKKFALEKAQQFDPSERQAEQLAELGDIEPVEPTMLVRHAEPPPENFDPESFAAPHHAEVRRNRRWVIGTSIALLAAILAGYLLINRPTSSVYLAVVDASTGASNDGEITRAAQAAVAAINDAGGIDGHPVELLTYDDHNDVASAVGIAKQIISDNKVLAVIGHRRSTTSLATFPLYGQAHIPVITPSATADQVTEGQPWAFRTVFDNRQEASGMAAMTVAYTSAKTAFLVSIDNAYGASLRRAFTSSFVQDGRKLSGDVQIPSTYASTAAMKPTVDQVVREFNAARMAGDTGPVILMANLDIGAEVIKGLRASGYSGTIAGSDSMGSGDIVHELTTGTSPVRDLSNIVIAVPVAKEALTGRAVKVIRELEESSGQRSTWLTPTTYQAVDLIQQASLRIKQSLSPDTLPQDRQAIRDALASATSPQTAFNGISAPVYFNDIHSAVMPTAILRGWNATATGTPSLEPAYLQLGLVDQMTPQERDEARRQGRLIEISGVEYERQSLVRIGVNINEIGELDTGAGTFFADAFVWIKYRGDERAPNIEFVNAESPIDLGKPVKSTIGPLGERYDLYRIQGTFKSQFDFSDFPFDTQALDITIQNVDAPATQLIYAPDPDLLSTSNEERLKSGVNIGKNIDNIPNWKADSVDFFQQSVGSSAALGDPTVMDTATTTTTYSQFVTETTISRDVGSFLVKNVLPLLLLVLVTYIALWTPGDDLATRVSFGVTGILTGAVMLSEVTASLPNVDYSVAIQWAYYAFIALSALVVLEGIFAHKLNQDGSLNAARQLDIIARVIYPLGVALIVFTYWAKFH
jgi:ABC-type branched-subunit amino acid transport system substrate-binding protein